MKKKRLVAFFEIPAADFSRAVKFYETVLNLELSVMECDAEKMAFFPEEDGKYPGAISFASGFNPSFNGILISLAVDCMDEVLTRITSAGGKIVKEKTKIEADNLGYFSMFTDSEGNIIGLYSDN
ncbi:VOC family protein [Dysgonomonas macrotermitis]|uniref:VOC domain-containing protein n=1 Tax=Dysgonomonas macrotermitis TaxID=1346286 RepID=A0A1M4SQU4_9BACT|nr:VOC family protein [Dysgonomonas macrotermitis]SHE34327.1 hypothetical protein SAMN05444362_101122 [Dysgonomonas macrotermitis]